MGIVFDWHKRFRDLADITTISRVEDPVFSTVLRTFKLLSFGIHGSGVELEFAVCSAVARFGDFYKDISSEWMERHLNCAAYGGSYFEKE